MPGILHSSCSTGLGEDHCGGGGGVSGGGDGEDHCGGGVGDGGGGDGEDHCGGGCVANVDKIS